MNFSQGPMNLKRIPFNGDGKHIVHLRFVLSNTKIKDRISKGEKDDRKTKYFKTKAHCWQIGAWLQRQLPTHTGRF